MGILCSASVGGQIALFVVERSVSLILITGIVTVQPTVEHCFASQPSVQKRIKRQNNAGIIHFSIISM